MSKTKVKYIACVILLASVVAVAIIKANAVQPLVSVERQDGSFVLMRHGQPYQIRGAGGDSHFAELAAAGANSVRTWGVDDLERVLDEAQRHGLTVCAGIWLEHQRHGFSYQDEAAVSKQLENALTAVEKYKERPALLLWGVGNEMEGEGTDPTVWKAVNDIAREIKRIDPHHPTMTVIAELGANSQKVKSIEELCPDIDIVGVNSYGGIFTVGDRYRDVGGTKPYIVTEHGTFGPWEVEKTSWGSPIEVTSTEKAQTYINGYNSSVKGRPGLCLGSYAFLWGNKQETTATWFGMLLPDGTRLGAVDVMSEAWTGKAPSNRCPEIESLKLDRTSNFDPGDTVHAELVASDPEDDSLTIEWVLRSDSGTIGAGGDAQKDEASFADAVKSDGDKASLTVPEYGTAFRLFAYVYDGQGGAAVANIPLQVKGQVKLDSVMPASDLPYTVYADDMPESVYIPSGYMGNTAAVSMQLDCTENPHSGPTCLKAQYNSSADWGGVLWQSPAEDWEGKQPGGANLTGATQLEFWARGAEGGETVNFVFGVLNGRQPFCDTASGELKDVKLSKEWTRLTFPLDDFDLRQIKTGFGWSLAGQGRPVTFYVDDIRYIE